MIKLKFDEMMTARGLKTADVAEQSGIAYNTVLNLRRGVSNGVTWNVLDGLCKVLNCTPCELITFEPDSK